MSTNDASLAFGAEGYRAAALAAVFLKHVHEGNEAGMQAVLDEVNAGGLVSEFVAALAAVAVRFGRRAHGEQLGRALQDCALRHYRASFHDHLPDSP